MKALTKTKTKLVVLLMAVAIVALAATLVLSATIRVSADETIVVVGESSALTSELNNATRDTVVQLGADISVANSVTISRTVTLDLNGHMLRYTGSANEPVITVTSGTLTLTDSKPNEGSHSVSYAGSTQTVTGGLVTGGKSGGVLLNGGNFVFNAGTIAGNTSSDIIRGGGVTCTSSAHTFTMNDGASIKFNTALFGGGVYMLSKGNNSFTMNGGAISNNTATCDGGGVYLEGTSGVLFTLKGGEISANQAGSGKGGAIFVKKVIALIDGGSVKGNSAYNGAGVYVDGGAVTMSGGEITQNASSRAGGAFYIKDGTLEISNGSISNNRTTVYGDGAGVYFESGTMTMSGGSITGNRIENAGTGAGVYFLAGTLNMRGTPIIKANTLSDNTANNLYLYSTNVVTVTGEISENAYVGVTLDYTRIFTSGYKKTTTQNITVKGFVSDNAYWSVVFSNTNATANSELTMTNPVVVEVTTLQGDEAVRYNDLQAAFAACTDEGKDYVFKLLAGVTTTTSITITTPNVTLDLNGHMILCTVTNRNVIEVVPAEGKRINFTLKDSRPEATPHEITSKYDSSMVKIYGGVIAGGQDGIYFNDNAANSGINFLFASGTIAGANRYGLNFVGKNNGKNTATMYSGATVRYNGSYGIYLTNYQSLTMQGGDVSYNRSYGICANHANTTFVLNDGRITYNYDGVYSKSKSVEINGGDISYNASSGICMLDTANAKLTVSDSTITHNKANYGISATGATATISVTNCQISYNGNNGIYTTGATTTIDVNKSYVLYNGCNGIYTYGANSAITVKDSQISFNGYNGILAWATQSNNKVYTDVDVTNTTISYNGYNGIYCGKTLNLTGSTISYNGLNPALTEIQDEYSNNIYAITGVATLKNCVIKGAAFGLRLTGNTGASGANDNNHRITDVEISEHTSAGVFMKNNARFTMESGEIKYNTGYGGVYIETGTFKMNSGSIHHNTETVNGGGGGISVRSTGSVSVVLENGEIYANKAANGGGLMATRSVATNGSVNVQLGSSFSIHDNEAEMYGGGICLGDGNTNTNTLTMSSGTITGNKATYGGGVALNGGTATTFTMTRGTITENTATHGGGVVVYGSAKFSMTQGSIIKNRAAYGAGVNYGPNGTVELGNEPHIENNTDFNDKPNNLLILDENKINIIGSLNTSGNVGLSIQHPYDGKVLTTNYNASNFSNTDIKVFVLDNPNIGSLALTNGSTSSTQLKIAINAVATVTVGDGVPQFFADFNSALTEAKKTSGSIITLLADIGVTATVELTNNTDLDLTLDLNGHMVRSSTGAYLNPLIKVGAKIHLTITDRTYDEDGVSTSVHLIVNPMTDLYEEIRGGIIRGNVELSGGSLDFVAGNICNGNNVTTSYGTGVYVNHASSKFTMSGNAAVCYNRYIAIYHAVGTTEIKEGSKIYSNRSTTTASAIYISGDNFSMTGGEIYGNLATLGSGSGGTIYAAKVFEMTGGSIFDNKFQGTGAGGKTAVTSTGSAGLFVTAANCTISNVSIFNNLMTATASSIQTWKIAGGVYVSGASFSMTDVSVYNNAVQVGDNNAGTVYSSGGVYATNTLTMNGGSIHDNQVQSLSSTSASAVYAEKEFTMTNNASIRNNTVQANTQIAAAVYVAAMFTMQDGEVVNNKIIRPDGYTTVRRGAGVYATAGVTFGTVINSVTVLITGNTDNGVDDNLQISGSAVITMAGKMNADTRIGLTHSSDTPNYKFTAQFATTGNYGLEYIFFPDATIFCMYYDTGEMMLTAHVNNASKYTKKEAIPAQCLGDGSNGIPECWECNTCHKQFVSVDGTYVFLDMDRDAIKPQHKVTVYVPTEDGRHVGKCEVCGLELVYGEHEADPNKQWVAAGVAGGKAQHSNVCVVCGVVLTKDCNYDGNINSNAEQHWLECVDCGQHIDSAPHSAAEDAWNHRDTYTHSAICECGYEIVANHTPNGKYFSDGGDYHYQTCTACNSTVSQETHTLHYEVANDNFTTIVTCTKCDYIDTNMQHMLGSECKKDEANHWYECQLHPGEKLNLTKHTFTYTAEKGQHVGTCTDVRCGYKTEAVACSYGAYTSSGDDGHYRVCSICGVEEDGTNEGGGHRLIPHTLIYIGNSDKHWQECTQCDYKKEFEGEEAAHKWEWKQSSIAHYEECSVCKLTRNNSDHQLSGWQDENGEHFKLCSACGYKADLGKHDATTKPVDANGHSIECSVCGLKKDSQPHDFGDKYQSNSSAHWQVCSACGYASAEVKHTFGKATPSENHGTHTAKCSECGSTVTSKCTYTFGKDEQNHTKTCEECDDVIAEPHEYAVTNYDENNHWKECECGWVDEETKAPHDYSDGAEFCKDCNKPSVDELAPQRAETIARMQSKAAEAKGALNSSKKTAYESQIEEALSKAVQAVSKAGKAEQITQAEKDFIDEINAILLLDAKDVAKADLEKKAEEAKKKLPNGLTDEQRKQREKEIDDALEKAKKAVDGADSVDGFESAINQSKTDFDRVIFEANKDVAKGELEKKAEEAKKNLPDDLTDEERGKYEKAIDDALEEAKKAVDGAGSLDDVEGAVDQSSDSFDDAILDTSKDITKDKVRQEAQKKKDELQDKVASGELTQEEADKAKDVIDKEVERAEREIDDAKSPDDVKDAEQRGNDVFDDIVQNPELAEEKSNARDKLEGEANKKKDEIQQEADKKKDEVDKDDTLTEEQKQQKKDEIQKEADEQKKKVDDAKKEAGNNVTESKNPEEIQDAVDKGLSNIDKAAEPERDPEKKSFFARMMEFFENAPLPLGIAAVTGGAMLFLVLILSIAARKPKKK